MIKNLIHYKFYAGMHDTRCPNKKKYVFDRLEIDSPPFVGSTYCLKQCEYFISHYKYAKMVECGFPEVQNVI